VNYLLDTHAFLWALFDPDRLSKKARQAIEDPDNTVYVSAATYWEISLKYALGKLVLTNVLPDALPDISRQMDFESMDRDADTASTFYKLPRDTHKDPFGRLVVWQAIKRNVTLVTKDKSIGSYRKLGLKTFWR
jgi:PIN domain nuclease of toxin-antitoxin system